MFNKLAKLIVGCFVLSVFLFSCKPTTDETTVTKTYGKIQVFHAAIEAPAINFLVDEVKINTDSLSYSKGTPYYLAVLTANKKNLFKVFIAKSGQMIAKDSLEMKITDVGYSVFVYQDKDASKTLRTIYTPDNLLAPAAGKAKVRFVHLLSDASVNIDVEAVAPGGSATEASQFTNLSFPKISDYIEMAKGTYDLKIKISGQKNVILNVTGVTIEEGKIYSLVARGYSQLSNKAGVTLITNK